MTALEIVFLVCAVAAYAASFFFAARGSSRAAFRGMLAGLALHAASAAVRWIAIGHPPIFGTYEAALSASWFVLLFVAVAFRPPHGCFRLLVLPGVPIALLLLLYGLAFNTQRMPLTISEISLWVDAHALFAWLAFAPFTLAFCLSAVYLWEQSRRDSAPPAALRPPLELIDELAFRYINVGFVNHSVMFALGCYYSSILFGTWWLWDPAFTISLAAWLSVALYIHLRLFYSWGGERAARLFAAIFALVVFSYWGLVYLPAGRTFHVFDIDVTAL
jgi:ABC-type transport system involved in cytochrome c biogenesis permease subunit